MRSCVLLFMVANMRGGSMEGFCVVDPWHQRLIKQKLGYSTVTSGELWNNHPEKAFAPARVLGGQVSKSCF